MGSHSGGRDSKRDGSAVARMKAGAKEERAGARRRGWWVMVSSRPTAPAPGHAGPVHARFAGTHSPHLARLELLLFLLQALTEMVLSGAFLILTHLGPPCAL